MGFQSSDAILLSCFSFSELQGLLARSHPYNSVAVGHPKDHQNTIKMKRSMKTQKILALTEKKIEPLSGERRRVWGITDATSSLKSSAKVSNFILSKAAQPHLTDWSQKLDCCSKTKGERRHENQELELMHQLGWTDNGKWRNNRNYKKIKVFCVQKDWYNHYNNIHIFSSKLQKLINN